MCGAPGEDRLNNKVLIYSQLLNRYASLNTVSAGIFRNKSTPMKWGGFQVPVLTLIWHLVTSINLRGQSHIPGSCLK